MDERGSRPSPSGNGASGCWMPTNIARRSADQHLVVAHAREIALVAVAAIGLDPQVPGAVERHPVGRIAEPLRRLCRSRQDRTQPHRRRPRTDRHQPRQKAAPRQRRRHHAVEIALFGARIMQFVPVIGREVKIIEILHGGVPVAG